MKFVTRPDISILEASSLVGFNISRFCYHESLSVVGSCRICLVEVEKSLRPAASCALPIMNNMRIHIDTPLVKKARESVIETLLLNHPLDCPICDQAGECDLQDLTKIFGGVYSRTLSRKRVIEDKECGVLIKTIMTRCIHCTRCVRFASEITGSNSLGTFNRGASTEIGGYTSLIFNSELSGNVIDLCPVGALTSKNYAFEARPWAMKVYESIDLSDSTGINTYIHLKEVDVVRVLPKKNDEINGNFISDKSRFSYDANGEYSIYNPLSKKKTNDTWEKFFTDIDFILKRTKQEILVILNSELDLEAIDRAQNLSYRTKGQIKVRTINFSSASSSFFETSNTDKISDITKNESSCCFLMSCNLRLEGSILNGKLRAKYRKEKFDIYSLGHPFLTNQRMEFVSIGALNLVSFFEGKSKYSGKFLEKEKTFLGKVNTSKKKVPLIFVGESFKKRFDPTSYFICFIKKVIPSAMVFSVDSSCNSNGASLMNVESVTSMDIKTSDILLFVNIDDTIMSRSILDDKHENHKRIYWLSTYQPPADHDYNFKVNIPLENPNEVEGIYLNLEGRPQKTSRTAVKTNSKFGLRSAKSVFKSFLNDLAPSFFLKSIFEMIKKPKKFTSVNQIFHKMKSEKSADFVLQISSYPLIASLEDFYTKGTFTKKSPTMIKCSQESRKESQTF